MAIMRCKAHTPTRTTRDYTGSVEPLGFPDTALICGSKHCTEPALIWLEREEFAEYQRGGRIFEAFTSSMKVRAQ